MNNEFPKRKKHTFEKRGFYDHIIRDKRDFDEISKYIYENPLKWQFDELYCEE